ncbi:MAG: helix-turn-helix domain-containing protein [Actinomycetota bacterium]
MRRKRLDDLNCAIAQTLEVVGDPWTLLIVRDLVMGVRRFDAIQRRLGIPRNTLTSRLEHLQDHEVVERVALDDQPNRFEYRLTDKGWALGPVLVTMLRWGDEWGDLEEPPVVFEQPSTGRRLDPVLVDRETGMPLNELGYEPRPGPGATRDGRR